jgi:hypothetical protein
MAAEHGIFLASCDDSPSEFFRKLPKNITFEDITEEEKVFQNLINKSSLIFFSRKQRAAKVILRSLGNTKNISTKSPPRRAVLSTDQVMPILGRNISHIFRKSQNKCSSAILSQFSP